MTSYTDEEWSEMKLNSHFADLHKSIIDLIIEFEKEHSIHYETHQVESIVDNRKACSVVKNEGGKLSMNFTIK